jgi:uncharacterized membrane protein YraQ (UPF0718 family)
MSQRRWVAIGVAVLLATLTRFCSCGKTAIVLGMLATRTPWAPIVAFMGVSPLTSPEELFLSAGLFGWTFALILFAGTDLSIVLAGDQVEPSAEGFDVAGDGVCGGDFATLYLGYPAGDDTLAWVSWAWSGRGACVLRRGGIRSAVP